MAVSTVPMSTVPMSTAPMSTMPMSQLPVEVTGFVGRQRELAELARLLGSARLVTVTGTGGVGKTRLALRAAAGASSFPDGVYLAELSGLRDPELLPHTVATCLGLPEQDSRSRLDAALDYLRDRELLLILDTCEHLVDACAMLADVLLRATTSVTVLATSRQPLDVPGEHTMSLDPLPVPGLDEELDGEQVGHGDAVELFVQRATAVLPGFAVTEANRRDVIGLCRRLDGVPLALELATMRLRALSLTQLAGRLEDRFQLLTGGRRAVLPHHQTLRTATEWSYDLCTPTEQLLWARLSVFAGAFDVEAAEEVCGGDGLASQDVLANLVGLVDKSVVLRVENGETRYRLLDTLREFGAEKLGRGTGAARTRHVARYVRLASYLGMHSQADDQIIRFRQLRAEHEEIRAALDYAFGLPGHDSDAAVIAGGLFGYWQMAGLMREGGYWLGKVLDRFTEPSPERARALMISGSLAIFRGETPAAIASVEEAIRLAEVVDDTITKGVGYMYLCLALLTAGRYDEAIAAGAIAEQRATANRDRAALVFIDYEMCYLHLLTGRLDEGLARCGQGLARLGPDSKELWIRGFLHLLKGLAQYLRGEHAASAEAFGIGLTMKHEVRDPLGTGYALEGMAMLAAAHERGGRAAWLLGAASELWLLVGSRLGRDPFLEALHQQTEDSARRGLGGARFDVLFRQGATASLDRVVTAAITDADNLDAGHPGTGDPGAGDPGASDPGASDPGAGDGAAPVPGPAKEAPLTSREREIAELVADGLSNRQIAQRLVISKRTVDAHIEHIYGKLGVSSRVQLANWLAAGRPIS
jgi:predicted ATPase/DNA-binding CsgD family transcriptional regulator